jgi:SAM-dependent methyltransferase
MNLDTVKLIFTSDLCLMKVALRSKLIQHARFLTDRLLDAGCGRKPYAHLIPCREYVGMEMNPKSDEDVKGSVLAIPFDAAAFDSAMCLEVIEHVPDPMRALTELFRVLKPGGYLYLTTPQMWYAHYEPHDFFRYTNHGLRHLLTEAGFEMVNLERTGGFWRFLFSRLIETTYRILRIVLFPLAVHNRSRNAVCRFLCFPLNLLGLAMVPLLDCFSKRDHLGWVALVRKPDTAATPAETDLARPSVY